MQLKSKLAALLLCAAAMSTSAQAQPAAARHSAPAQTPAEQPVKYQLLLASSLLLMMFGWRGTAPAQPWSKD